MLFSEKHEELRDALARFVDSEINPYVNEWEEAEIGPWWIRTHASAAACARRAALRTP